MKNNTLLKTENLPDSVLLNSKGSACVIVLMVSLFACQDMKAQLTNLGTMKISGNTIMSIDMNYINASSGNFVNDGDVHVLQNWKNNGSVSYTDKSKGNTLFHGDQPQLIEGVGNSNFQNVVFNNLTGLIPFDLKTIMTIGQNSDFRNGIINSGSHGLMIFNEKAKHTNAGDQSFVDGLVRKKMDRTPNTSNDTIFQYPVGNDLYFRPLYSSLDSSKESSYTTQYLHKNPIDLLHPHDAKEASIISINKAEFWSVTQNEGSEHIVLSLTLNKDTTPSDFFNKNSDTQLAIIRWDERNKRWINEGGELSDYITGEAYSNLLTSKVSGYGIFTMAIVNKIPPPPPGVIVYNAISPNGDGKNDAFLIEGINKYPDNNVEIYNRWGVKVYDAKSYNENDVMFRGYSEGRGTIKKGEKLPTGTYFYILRYNNGEKNVEKSGYLYVNNQ